MYVYIRTIIEEGKISKTNKNKRKQFLLISEEKRHANNFPYIDIFAFKNNNKSLKVKSSKVE